MGDSFDSSSLDDSAAVELSGKIMVVAIVVLFFVVVFVLFLHLYAKWFWWRTADRGSSFGGSRRRRRRFVFAPGQDPALPAMRRGLDPSILGSIPVLVFRPEEFKDGLECAVCLSELVTGEKARLLPKCNHGFHVECIDMWFQSHSTCPLCRNLVATVLSDPTTPQSPESIQLSEESSAAGDYSLESPNYPTNILFWGNQTRVTSAGLCLEEGAASSQPPCASPGNGPDGMLVIDIPRQTAENFSSLSPSTGGTSEEELKSPMTTRLRSLKRLLSREKRVVPCSPGSVDVEQGGRGQSSKSTLDV